MAKGKERELKDMDIREVSFVTSPANKRKFLFHKAAKLKVEFETDGTVKGTTIKVNGEAVEKVKNFHLGFYSDSDGNPVSCSYTKNLDTGDGFVRTETYYLSKGDVTMKETLAAVLKSVLGDKFNDQVILADELEPALTTIHKYQEDFPDDLAEALQTVVLSKAATLDPVELEKVGRKFSGDTLGKIRTAAKTLLDLIGGLTDDEDPKKKDKTQKSEESTTVNLTPVLEALGKLGERLTKIEGTTPSSQVAKGQDTDSDDDDTPETPSTPASKVEKGQETPNWGSLTAHLSR